MLSVSELLVQLKTFRTEVESRLRSLELASEDAQQSISNAADRLVSSLDDRVRALDMDTFLDVYGGDMDRAVEALAVTHIRSAVIATTDDDDDDDDDSVAAFNKKRLTLVSLNRYEYCTERVPQEKSRLAVWQRGQASKSDSQSSTTQRQEEKGDDDVALVDADAAQGDRSRTQAEARRIDRPAVGQREPARLDDRDCRRIIIELGQPP